MIVKFKKLGEVKIPTYAKPGDAGMDFYLPDNVDIFPGINKIDLKIAMEIPDGYVLFLKERSGISLGYGLEVLAGVIDSGYRGSISVVVRNNDNKSYFFERGSKIVQGVILPIPIVELKEVDELSESERGNKGFGSTGV